MTNDAKQLVDHALSGMDRYTTEPWYRRHLLAVYGLGLRIEGKEAKAERAILQLIESLASQVDLAMVDWHFRDHWADQLNAARAMLNYDMGRLDCGLLDSALCKLAAYVGYSPETLEWDATAFESYRESVGY
jgi:hypothetical protein